LGWTRRRARADASPNYPKSKTFHKFFKDKNGQAVNLPSMREAVHALARKTLLFGALPQEGRERPRRAN
jgi:hypothetical protein